MSDTPPANVATLLAQERTALAFERTRMATDRTMMATLRTSFSMVGFGFTLFSFFRVLASDDLLGETVPQGRPAMFGLALVLLGILVLAHGLWSESRFRTRLNAKRERLIAEGLLSPDEPMLHPAVNLSAFLLLLLALLAVLGMAARLGPFA